MTDRQKYLQYWRINNKSWIRTRNKKYYDKAKSVLLGLKTSGCAICGYIRCPASLSFHHVNPEDMSFRLVAREIVKHNNQAIQTEFEKCILLCANCHHELHWCEALILVDDKKKEMKK